MPWSAVQFNVSAIELNSRLGVKFMAPREERGGTGLLARRPLASPSALSRTHVCSSPCMVPPTYNRVRGKDKDQRTRDKRHRDKMNAKQAGKIAPLLVKDRGKGAAGVGKKKMKVGEPCSNYASPVLPTAC